MCHKTLFSLLLIASFLCSGESIINFSDPLDAPRSVRNGIFKSTDRSERKDSLIYWQNGPFLPTFNLGKLVLSIATPVSPLSFTLVMHDRLNRKYRIPLKQTNTKNGVTTYSTSINSFVSYPYSKGKDRGKQRPEQPLRLRALVIRGNESVKFKSIDFFEQDIMVSLKTGKAVSVLDLRTDAVPVFEAVNHSGSSCEVTINYSVKDIKGTNIDSGKKVLSLKSGEKKLIALERPALQGVYTVNYTFSKDNRQFSLQNRFAAIVPAKRRKTAVKDNFALGFCVHFQRYSKQDVEKMVELLALCGSDEVRLGWLWNQINPARNVWDFTRVDWFVGMLDKYKIRSLALMGAAPKHAETTEYKRTNTKAALHLPKGEYFEEWLRRFATHYNGRIHKFCVWNEPDVAHFADFSPEEYLKLQQIAYRTLKSVNPNNNVIAGGFSYMLNAYSRKVLELMVEQASDSADTISTHLYAPVSRFSETLADCRRFMKNLGLKQALCSEETGVGTKDDQEQILVLFQKVIQCRAEGITLFYWYNLRNCGSNPKNKEDNFGLLEYDLNPRGGYVTFNMLSSLYGNSRFVRKEAWNGFYASRFESVDSALYALWLKKKSQVNMLAVFETDAEKVELIDLFGNAERLSPKNGKFVVTIDSVGQTIRLFPAKSSLKLSGEVLIPAKYLNIRPGEEKDFFFLCNNLPGNVTLQVLPCDQLSSSPAKQKSPSCFRISVRATKKFRPGNSNIFQIQVMRDGKKIGKPVGFRFQNIFEIPYGKMTKVGYVGRRTQVRNMLPNTPEYGKFFWTDYRDCHVAFGATAGKNEILHFQIGMNDDIHVQNFSAEEMWKGDSIQLVILFPGQSDYWELGIAMTNDGKLLKHIWRAPKGMDIQNALAGMRVSGKKLKGSHNFHLILSLSAFGTSVDVLEKDGAYFNILANDNDGEFRESQLSFMEDDGTNPEERIRPDSPFLMVK